MAEHEQTKVCPHCAEIIKAAAKVCPHCRYWQKKWSLYNPKLLTAFGLVVLTAYCAGIGIFMDKVFGPKEQFALKGQRDGGLKNGPACEIWEFSVEMILMANKITAANAGWPLQFRIRGSRRWPGVAEFCR
jgi:hypothetical protein